MKAGNDSLQFNFTPSNRFGHISVEQGLSNTIVRSILQDSLGYLWFGTSDGLNRYDGFNIKVFHEDPDDSTSIIDNNIESIYEDRSGTLWIGTLFGWLERYDRELNQFSHYQIGSHVLSMLEDSKENFWVGTQDPGLFQFDRETEEARLVWNGNNIRVLFEDREGTLWIGSTSEGLFYYDSELEEVIKVEGVSSISSMVQDNSGMIWCSAGRDGLVRFNPGSNSEGRIGLDQVRIADVIINNITSLVYDRYGILYIGTYGDGIIAYNTQTTQVIRFAYNPMDQHSLRGNNINTMHLDKSEVLWVGTTYHGIEKIFAGKRRFNRFRNIPGDQNSLCDNVVNAILEDRTGFIWVGTFSGLNRFERQTGEWVHFLYDDANPNSISSNEIWSINEDPQGNIWIGTGTGLDLYHPETGSFSHWDLCVSYDMIQDRSGQYLLATRQGFYEFNPDEQVPLKLVRPGYSWKISLLEDSRGYIWLGTSGDGVERYNPRTNEWDLFDHDPIAPTKLNQDFVECMVEDGEGNIWFGTDDGLIQYQPDSSQFYRYTVKDGLPHNWIVGIGADKKGNIWLATFNGISKFDPVSGSFQNYNTDYQNRLFRRGAYHQSKSGEIFFGGNYGVASFNPEQTRNNQVLPTIVISGMSVFNKMIRTDIFREEYIELGYRESFLSFDFVAIESREPSANKYAYMMEGLDEDWIYAENRMHTDYPGMDPGTYIFRVKGSNNDGVWNEEGISVHIQIHPPFWQTWFFRISLIIIAIITLYLLVRSRISSIEAKRKDLEIRLEEKAKSAEALQEALDEVESLKNRLQEENIYLQDEIRNTHNFENFVTNSDKLKKVLHSVEQVASTDATVLILGESGTGKELIARAIHNISPRSNRPLVKVNCAVLPASLIESELFGHEKGAFTGAITQKIGRFELADGGTIFLDEIGDLPLELQSKLLRILQEGEFERLGNPRTLKVNVRVMAATNRELEKEIELGNFRSDLFYRLNVFPITIAPLRDRKEDIPLLVNHFIQKYSAKVGKNIDTVSQHILKILSDYHWPGNVRELENIIERAVVISKSNKLLLGDWFSKSTASQEESRVLTLEEIEKKHILKVLDKTGWRVSGEKGAAKILGLKRTTLEARMQKLNISRQ